MGRTCAWCGTDVRDGVGTSASSAPASAVSHALCTPCLHTLKDALAAAATGEPGEEPASGQPGRTAAGR